MNTKVIALLAALSTIGISMLAGCGVGPAGSLQPSNATAGVAIAGSVHGGQQPVVGATIQLYAAGSTGYGSAAIALLSPAATSGAGGSFTVGSYTCPSPSAPVYVVATGGNSGSTNNANLALMAALGPCGNLSASTFVSLNEVTTVGSVYALSPFMTGMTNSYTKVGVSANNALGLSNAMADVNVLTNIATGSTPGSTSVPGATIPVQEINTLADIVASCVNSGGGSYNDSSACGTLFYNANPGGTSATAPTDTITALMNIAQHPASSSANVTALYGLAAANPPFQPTLSATPNDFTLALTLAAGSLSSPSGLAMDASGNVWISNAGANTVTELSHTGTPLSGSGYTASLSSPSAVALAPDGTVWITNRGNNTVSRLSSTGAAYSGSPYSGGGLNLPRSIAFDSSGTAWIANGGGASVTTISSSGSTPTNYAPAGTSSPVAIAVNPH